MVCDRTFAMVHVSARCRADGASMLLGPDGDQLVPGHPHIWVEPDNATTYIGYDYRRGSGGGADYMGVRRLHWHNGCPTIWTPITLTVRADDHPSAVGQPLTLSLRNTGDAASKAAFDGVRVVEQTSAASPPTPPAQCASPGGDPPVCALDATQRQQACACQYVWSPGCVTPTSVQLYCE